MRKFVRYKAARNNPAQRLAGRFVHILVVDDNVGLFQQFLVVPFKTFKHYTQRKRQVARRAQHDGGILLGRGRDEMCVHKLIITQSAVGGLYCFFFFLINLE